MINLEWMREFVERFDAGLVDAAEFTDHANDLIDALRYIVSTDEEEL